MCRQQLRRGPAYGYTHAAFPPERAVDARRLWRPSRIGISLAPIGAVPWSHRRDSLYAKPLPLGPAMTANAAPFVHHMPVTLTGYTQCAMSNPRSPESPTLRQRALSALQRARRAIRGRRADVSSPPLQWQIDWDNDVPPFPIFAGEVARAIGDAQRNTQAEKAKSAA